MNHGKTEHHWHGHKPSYTCMFMPAKEKDERRRRLEQADGSKTIWNMS